MDAKLIVVGGKASKSRVSVKLPSVIGRSREADLTVAHPMVSRQHCELYEADGVLMIRDLGSLNGLYVDGKQVSETVLRPNAEFAVGPLTFRVEYEGDDEAPASLGASTVDEEAPEAELLPQAEAGPPAEVSPPPNLIPEAVDFDLEVTEVEPEDSEADSEAPEVDLDVGGFDLDVDGAAPEPAEAAPEATEFNPEIDGFRPEQDPPETDLRKTVSGKETLIIPAGLTEAKPGPEPPDIPPAAAPADEQSPDFSAWGTGGDDAEAPDGDQVPEPPGAGQPPEIAPGGTDRATVQWEPGMDEETVDDEPDEEEPPNEDLDDFLKGFE